MEAYDTYPKPLYPLHYTKFVEIILCSIVLFFSVLVLRVCLDECQTENNRLAPPLQTVTNI